MNGFDHRDTPELRPRKRPALTLFDLIAELSESGASDVEVVAAVADLVARGRLRIARDVDGADALPVFADWASGDSVDLTNHSYNDGPSVPVEADVQRCQRPDRRPQIPGRAPSSVGTSPAPAPDRASSRGELEGDER